jgi:hypothetical protein
LNETVNLKEEVGGLIPDFEVSSLLDGKLAMWSTACSYALALDYRTSIEEEEEEEEETVNMTSPSIHPTIAFSYPKYFAFEHTQLITSSQI